jgi:hypothetical protein
VIKTSSALESFLNLKPNKINHHRYEPTLPIKFI